MRAGETRQKYVRRWAIIAALALAVGLAAGVGAGRALAKDGCQTTKCHWRVQVRQYRPWLEALGACETRGMSKRDAYRADTGNGYYGRYQFSLGTWHIVGGKVMPNEASPEEQDFRAVVLLKRFGPGHWPNCP